MDWLPKVPKSESKQIVFSKKSLTPQGIVSTESSVNIEDTQKEADQPHPEYSSKQLKEIFDYFKLISSTKDYLLDVQNNFKFRYEIFTRHPLFNKFLSRLRQKYSSEWKYNFIILKKDRLLVENMRNLLKDIVENPSKQFDFKECEDSNNMDWKEVLKGLQDVVKVIPRMHKSQLRSTYFKLKKMT